MASTAVRAATRWAGPYRSASRWMGACVYCLGGGRGRGWLVMCLLIIKLAINVWHSRQDLHDSGLRYGNEFS